MAETAPLIATRDAPIPDGGEAMWFSGAGGARLRAALFRPRGRARGSIVLSGGRTEPIEKYFEVIGDFLDRGFVVLAHDWRGQGLSHRALGDPLKGHADGAKAYVDDFKILLDTFADRLPKPWVAVGHSMGGCLTLLAMAQGEHRFVGAIFSAPMLGVQTGGRSPAAARMMVQVSKLFGRARRYVLNDPGKPFDDVFETNVLTHDRRRYARACGQLAAEPKLALGAPTWGWLDFAFKATAELARPERLSHITVPVIILSAEDDKLVDNAAQQRAARHLPQGKFINVPGAFHEILMETDQMRNFFMKAFDSLTGRVAPKPAEPPKAAPATPPKPPAPTMATSSAPMMAAASPAPAAKKPAAKKKAPAKKKAAAKPAAAKKAPAAKKPAAKKSAAKKPAAKKPAAKPAAAKKPPAAKKPAAKKPAAKKASAKKPAAKPAAAKKAPAAKKPAAKKPAAKKPAAKKPAARKPAAKK
ncbi:alpha/beta hydrolase [Phenylobacterium sp.]|uniref:alpha/beta hydrolase n=1 Tax=Phenylobacterium sp. TaxID=1871053 RepID=UPI002DE73638|nr:alpha/beta hydrolase [Phenylobacterium sp.]